MTSILPERGSTPIEGYIIRTSTAASLVCNYQFGPLLLIYCKMCCGDSKVLLASPQRLAGTRKVLITLLNEFSIRKVEKGKIVLLDHTWLTKVYDKSS